MKSRREARIANLEHALNLIVEARDFHAEVGHYPQWGPDSDQSFDDWAADLAEDALDFHLCPCGSRTRGCSTEGATCRHCDHCGWCGEAR